MDAPDSLSSLARGYRLSLEASNKAKGTVTVYLSALERFGEWLEAHGRSTSVAEITRAEVEGFIASLLSSRALPPRITAFAPSNFLRLVSRRGRNRPLPMERMKPPQLPERPVDVVSDDDMRRPFACCSGRSYEDRRDCAILPLRRHRHPSQRARQPHGRGRRPRTWSGLRAGQGTLSSERAIRPQDGSEPRAIHAR